jgi:hypothetical protein
MAEAVARERWERRAAKGCPHCLGPHVGDVWVRCPECDGALCAACAVQDGFGSDEWRCPGVPEVAARRTDAASAPRDPAFERGRAAQTR